MKTGVALNSEAPARRCHSPAPTDCVLMCVTCCSTAAGFEALQNWSWKMAQGGTTVLAWFQAFAGKKRIFGS